MSDLKPCPCGKTPEGLHITDTGQGGKYFNVSGLCCGDWETEFRTNYEKQDSAECMELAVSAWNEANRAASDTKQLQAENERLKAERDAFKAKNQQHQADKIAAISKAQKEWGREDVKALAIRDLEQQAKEVEWVLTCRELNLSKVAAHILMDKRNHLLQQAQQLKAQTK